ncbi:uncharacterized protein K452DRAFT_306878 [Aplosporella prunicola CBS 121167]|uniref:Transcription factor Iwr1 domain-containing protein n=1 Tax=Aplosporella prunicola CBS 121167 TaxID=1176127 RepID=A0A6A6BP16_9PEZI|nr:uncharacterized protein K452DRAFT_306878 [Aplosporella prunicola CBS 121167]KAF2144291.1 hypothetical protein K452DRAFT_306878 [Aplosporella prunicola CBS 121167]
MSQLPQTVRIKRKRQDEPVETLHIRTQDDPNKRRLTEPTAATTLTSIFKRVHESKDVDTSATASPALSTSSRPSSPRLSDRKVLTPRPTRRFHLSRGSYSGPPGGVQKRKNVATLVETKLQPLKARKDGVPPALANYLANQTASHDGDVDMDMPEQRQPKRPLTKASSSKGRWTSRAEGNKDNAKNTLGRDGVSDATAQGQKGTAPSQNDVDQNLLRQMQEFAQEVEESEKSVVKPRYQPQMPATPPKLKFQPRTPQIARYRDRHPEGQKPDSSQRDVDMENSDIEDGEYVYDTYIRYDGPSDTLIDPLKSDTLPPNIGLLIISEEDQPLWEEYLEDVGDQGSDFDFEDEEDENAEDFYGNEYPEEEVASDDEYDQGAYNYRVGASDDEEYGLSDEDEFNDLRRPWGSGKPAWMKGDKSKEDSDDDEY